MSDDTPPVFSSVQLKKGLSRSSVIKVYSAVVDIEEARPLEYIVIAGKGIIGVPLLLLTEPWQLSKSILSIGLSHHLLFHGTINVNGVVLGKPRGGHHELSGGLIRVRGLERHRVVNWKKGRRCHGSQNTTSIVLISNCII